jgi:beta-1,4-mannosyltransferase
MIMIKILFNERLSSHPYFTLLYAKICEDNQFFVHDIKSYPDALIKLVTNTDILHLHWIESLFRGSPKNFKLPKIILRSFVYINFFIVVKFLLKKRIIITLHNVRPHEILYPNLEKFLFRFSLKLADGIIVHNYSSKLETIKLYKLSAKDIEKIVIIPHGNFIGYYKNEISKESARDYLNIPKNKFVLLFFGHVRSETRGIEVLLDVFEELIKIDSSLYLIIGGKCESQPLKKKLYDFSQRHKENSLVNLTFIPNNDIQTYMNASDIGILPFTRISTSGSLMLFISFGKPIIVSRLKSIEDVLGNYPLFFESNNPKELKEMIIHAKKVNLNNLSRQVYEIAEQYDWGDIAKKTNQLYLKSLQ